jgi:hypothetical protein
MIEVILVRRWTVLMMKLVIVSLLPLTSACSIFLGDMFCVLPCGFYYCAVHWELLPRQTGTGTTTTETTNEISSIE